MAVVPKDRTPRGRTGPIWPYRPKIHSRHLIQSGGGGAIDTSPTIIIFSDMHVGSENNDRGDPNVRMVEAINSMPGTIHPQGGTVGAISATIGLGDCKHEDTESVERMANHFVYPHATGVQTNVRRILDGNHDQNDVRDLIIEEYGSLTWGVNIGGIWFQALTENYTAPDNTTPPTVAQITGPVAASLAARPATEPVMFCLHRPLMDNNGYMVEWDEAALDAFEALAASRRTVGILFGHDHYVHHSSWRGIRCFSPGSVRQSPEDAPYSTTYAETFLVMRIRPLWYDIANFRYGYDVNRNYSPNVWEWVERIYY